MHMESSESSSTARFLVIEDDPDHQKIAAMTLQSEGISDITFFNNGEEAIAFFEADNPGNPNRLPIILIDLMLPNISGFDILEHLRSNERWKACKKVVLTCSTSLEDQTRSLKYGADAFFSKPFRREYLQEIIASLS
jgi:CheY-like chemotaxis protein